MILSNFEIRYINLEIVKRNAIVFDVSGIFDRDIEVSDIEMSYVLPDMFIAFYTSFIEKEEYGTKTYFKSHPQLSNELIYELLNLGISIVGIDCAGVRRGVEHTPKDQYCADRGAFAPGSNGTVSVFKDLYGNLWDLVEFNENHPMFKRVK